MKPQLIDPSMIQKMERKNIKKIVKPPVTLKQSNNNESFFNLSLLFNILAIIVLFIGTYILHYRKSLKLNKEKEDLNKKEEYKQKINELRENLQI
tara:strand:+ start:312 stop:596 length:285 start_codon:yes stop_codon:yes gene_type:complete